MVRYWQTKHKMTKKNRKKKITELTKTSSQIINRFFLTKKPKLPMLA